MFNCSKTNMSTTYYFALPTISRVKFMKQTISLILGVLLSISAYSQLYPYKKNDLWGYIDSTGKEKIMTVFPLAGFFYEGMAYVQINDALGYINLRGDLAIKPQYPAAFNFSEGYTSVMINESWGVINKRGELVIPPIYSAPLVFHDSLARFKLERGLFSTYGYINPKGDTVLYPKYEKAGEFHNQLCMVSEDGLRYGYINTKGKYIIPPVYELGALIKVNNEYDLSDKSFSDGYVSFVRNNKFGVFDTTGKVVIEPTFAYIGKFTEGVAPAKMDSLYGFINPKGEWVIAPLFDGAERFTHGLAAVAKGKLDEQRWGFINHEGKVVIPINIYSYYSPYENMVFGDGLVPCYVEKDVFGYINRKGEVVWKLVE